MTGSISALKEGDIYTSYPSSLDMSAIQTEVEQDQNAITARHYRQVTAHYTRDLNAVQSELSSTILLHRVHSYGQQKKYQETLEDANQVLNAFAARASALYFLERIEELM
ncbi:hypothetical protein BDA99DRAFT_600729 [Phascolomyces articulosus]|uniref:Uncharacterized protein n=1 Tax=Phascolomyces articulosus TaxID=60185 RepID=A0AAD5KP92_9FUNG|nr:hypothetical protein BDA99DRAFT_600729 [Phascolomyces articulosus]